MYVCSSARVDFAAFPSAGLRGGTRCQMPMEGRAMRHERTSLHACACARVVGVHGITDERVGCRRRGVKTYRSVYKTAQAQFMREGVWPPQYLAILIILTRLDVLSTRPAHSQPTLSEWATS
jgi:hypothetical protein